MKIEVGRTKIEIGQFYLGSHDTVFIFTERCENHVEGRAWQNKLAHKVTVSVDKDNYTNYSFIPIDPVIAKMIQSGQHAIDTGLV